MAERFSYRFDRYIVEPHTASLLCDGSAVTVEPKSFQVLLFLLEHRDRLVDKQELLDNVWPDTVVTENAVTRAIARLRKALDDDPRQPRYIATVHTRGYRFVAAAEQFTSTHGASIPELPEPVGARSNGWLERPLTRLIVAAASALLLTAVVARYVTDAPHPAGATDSQALDPRRIAVLPMTDLRSDSDDPHIVDGLTEQMISVLSRIDGVRTVPRTSAMAYKSSDQRISEIGRELGAGTVLESSLSSAGSPFRITLRLIDVASEENLWSKEVDCSLIDFFAVQSEAAAQIAKIFEGELSTATVESIARGPTQTVSAYEKYLEGRAYFRQTRRVANEKAIESYRAALELDPDFALALAGLANAYAARVVRFGFDPDEGIAQAMSAAERALELEPNLPEAYLAIGAVEFRRSRLRSSMDYTLKALELNPDYDEAIFSGTLFSYELGRLDDSLLLALRDRRPPIDRQVEYALRLWELHFEKLALERVEAILKEDPLNLRIGIYLAVRELIEGKIDAARSRLARLIDAYQNNELLWRVAGDVEWAAGDPDKALEYFERAVAAPGTHTDAGLRVAMIRWQRGDRPEAASILDAVTAYATGELERGSEWSHDALALAAVETIRGNLDDALRWYEKAVDDGHRAYYWDEVDPLLAPLRQEPRFIEQIDRMRSEVTLMKERVVREVGVDLSSFVREAWPATG